MARLARGMYLRDVACALGVSKQAVSLWELGKRTPQVRHVRALARIYKDSRLLTVATVDKMGTRAKEARGT